MKVAYLECFAGIAGDMFLSALVDAGVSPVLLQDAADSLGLGVALEFSKVDRSGIQSTRARVLVGGVDAEVKNMRVSAEHSHSHAEHTHSEHEHKHAHAHTHGHPHTHEHAHTPTETQPHVHGRSLSQIRVLIDAAAIAPAAKQIALDAFQRLGEAEAGIHGKPIEEIHFHEVGAVDAIVDIVCGAVGADSLGVDAWYCSPVNTGSGFVDCAHGRFPVPAPATLALLRGVPLYEEGPAKELTTPTGAALIAAFRCRFDRLPGFITDSIGYGAGTRNPDGFPNVLRLRVGHLQARDEPRMPAPLPSTETVTVLECAIDDATPEVLAFAAQSILAHGALDVIQQSVFMKKGRQGTLLTVLCRPADAGPIEHLLFRETTTLGMRIRQEQRSILERSSVEVATEFGAIPVKLGLRNGTILNAAPEFEPCRQAAEKAGVPLKQVMQTAMAVYAASMLIAAYSQSPAQQ